MDNLIKRHCVPCEHKTPPLNDIVISELKQDLELPWEITTDSIGLKKLRHEFNFANFPQVVSFVNKIVPIAEHEGHHPDLYIFYNRVRVELYTHSISGLSENDFIMAAKIENLYKI